MIEEDNFRYRLDIEQKTKVFRLVLINTVNAALAGKEIEQKGWITICKFGEREFLKAFVRYVKKKYESGMLTKRVLRREMRDYERRDYYLKAGEELKINLNVAATN